MLSNSLMLLDLKAPPLCYCELLGMMISVKYLDGSSLSLSILARRMTQSSVFDDSHAKDFCN